MALSAASDSPFYGPANWHTLVRNNDFRYCAGLQQGLVVVPKPPRHCQRRQASLMVLRGRDRPQDPGRSIAVVERCD